MKKIFTLIATALLTLGAQAETKTVQWAVSDGGQNGGTPVTVKDGDTEVGTVAFGTADNWTTADAKVNVTYKDVAYAFSAYFTTTSTNGNGGADLASDGSSTYNYIAINPKYSGTLVVVVQNGGTNNTGKPMWCYEDGEYKSGTIIGDGTLSIDYDGHSDIRTLNDGNAVNGGIKFDVTAGKHYTLSVNGSKARWCGIIYEYDESTGKTDDTPSTDPITIEGTKLTLGGQAKNGNWSWGWNNAFGSAVSMKFTSQWGEFKIHDKAFTNKEYPKYKLTLSSASPGNINLRVNDADNADNTAYIGLTAGEKVFEGEFSIANVKDVELQATEAGMEIDVASFVLIDADGKETQGSYATNWGVSTYGAVYTSSSQWGELYVNGAEETANQTLTVYANANLPEGMQFKVYYDEVEDHNGYIEIPAGAKTASVTIENPYKAVSIQAKEAGITADIIAVTVKTGGSQPAEGEITTFDFTTNTWGLPEESKEVDKKDFTNGTYTITLEGTSGNGYRYYANDQYLLIGKQNATLTLPAFNFDVEAIEVTGRSSASAAVQQNIFVGEEAVSEATTGAQGTNVYKIAEGKQAAGTIYTIKVLSNHNTQFTKIVVYPKGKYVEPGLPVANTIAKFTALGTGTDAKLKLDGAKVTFVNADKKYVYVRDASGGMCFYNQSAFADAANTWTLGGTVEGKVSIYNGMTQMTVSDASALTHTEGTAYQPVAIDATDAASHLADVVTLNGTVTIVKDGNKFYTDDTKALQIYDNFKLGYTLEEGQQVTGLTGVVIPYNTQIEIAPINADLTAGIRSITADEDVNAPAYNLGGQRVGNGYKGIVIKNGKKVMVK